MNITDKKIIESYSDLFEGLSFSIKLELTDRLTKSLKVYNFEENNFYKSFGTFGSKKSAEKIVSEIKFQRRFENTEIKF